MRRLWTAVVGLMLVAHAACAPPLPEDPDGRPATLIFAVDGLDWDLLLPAMREGRAPNLLDLARRGSAARLSTFEPTDSPVIWTSVATGKVKEKHGITVFAEQVGDRLVPVTSNQRLARGFWSILGDAGHSVGIVGWWVTWPAEPVRGFMVAPISTVAGRTWKGSLYGDLPDQTWPPELIDELQPTIRHVEEGAPALLERLLPPTADPPEWLAEFRRDLGWSLTTDRIFSDAAERLIRERSPRVVAVYQGAVDVGGHRFWGFTARPDGAPAPNDLPEAQADVVAGYLPAALEEIDAALGRLRAAMPPDTDVIVISDHGMHERRARGPGAPWRSPLLAFNTGAHGDAPDGVWIAAGPSFKAPKPPFKVPDAAGDLPLLGSRQHPAVLDVVPTLLHIRGLAVADDMDGHVLAELLVENAARRPVARLATYETGPPPADRPRPIPTRADDDVVERLRSLGYLGGE